MLNSTPGYAGGFCAGIEGPGCTRGDARCQAAFFAASFFARFRLCSPILPAAQRALVAAPMRARAAALMGCLLGGFGARCPSRPASSARACLRRAISESMEERRSDVFIRISVTPPSSAADNGTVFRVICLFPRYATPQRREATNPETASVLVEERNYGKTSDHRLCRSGCCPHRGFAERQGYCALYPYLKNVMRGRGDRYGGRGGGDQRRVCGRAVEGQRGLPGMASLLGDPFWPNLAQTAPPRNFDSGGSTPARLVGLERAKSSASKSGHCFSTHLTRRCIDDSQKRFRAGLDSTVTVPTRFPFHTTS